MAKTIDMRGFSWVSNDLFTFEVSSKAFYHEDKLYCSVDIWNSTKTRVIRRTEILYSDIQERFEAYQKARVK